MSGKIVAVAALLTAAIGGAAHAAELAGMHAQVRVGGKTCMATHFHYMEGGGFASEAKARAYATKAWESYTHLEYGTAWARYSMSTDKAVTCVKRPAAAGPVTSCEVKARPCRAGY